jgi:hypothetical protein
VADYHTYFVGSREWGFSVWAHNADCFVIEHRGAGRWGVKNARTGEWVEEGGRVKLFSKEGAGAEAALRTREGLAQLEAWENEGGALPSGPQGPSARPPTTPAKPASTRPPAQRLHPDKTLAATEHRSSVQYWEGRSTQEIVDSLRTGKNPGERPGEPFNIRPDGVIDQGNTRVWILERRHGLTTPQVVDIIEGRAPIPGGSSTPGPSPSGRQQFDDLFKDPP